MKLYLDTCCYNRPFDDQTQERIYLESEVILTILKQSEIGTHQILGSDILELEIGNIRNIQRKQNVKRLYQICQTHISYVNAIKIRSQEIMNQSNIQALDSLHIAAAESAGADILLTTDDKLEKMAERLKLKVKVMNPLKFALEEI